MPTPGSPAAKVFRERADSVVVIHVMLQAGEDCLRIQITSEQAPKPAAAQPAGEALPQGGDQPPIEIACR